MNTIEELRCGILNCNNCPLHQENIKLRDLFEEDPNLGYGNPVPGIGLPTARMMIFGEAPGADEVKSGKPFVGKAGNLLRQALEEIEADPRDIYIANVINCRPPGNKFPTEEETIAACVPWARKQIAAIRPKVVVGLGSQPLKYIFRSKEKLSSVYGQQFPWHINAINLDTIYAPSLHPSFCLRPGRNYDILDSDEMSDGQKMMALTISEKTDMLKRHLFDAYQLLEEI